MYQILTADCFLLVLWFSLDYVTVCWEVHVPSYGNFSSLKNSFYPAPGHTLKMAA